MAYDTGTGQTATVARSIGSTIADSGHDVTVRHVSNVAALAVDGFDGVLVGSPVITNRHPPAVVEFVEAHRDTVTARPTGFFQPSFASASPGSGRKRARWAGSTRWSTRPVGPDRIGLFAGALDYRGV